MRMGRAALRERFRDTVAAGVLGGLSHYVNFRLAGVMEERC